MRGIFEHHYKTNFWGSNQSVSGAGSELEATETIREELPKIFEQLEARSVLDIPCGDFFWGEKMKWPDWYIGADVVPALIDNVGKRMRGKRRNMYFSELDATKDALPRVDVIFCRDMLGHLTNLEVKAALKNFRASGSKYLISTTFPGRETVQDIETGQWRPIDLDYMWGLPKPIAMINENCQTVGFQDKSLGVWKLQDY